MDKAEIEVAPQKDAIVYIAAKNMITAFIPALAPVIGGLLADFFFESWIELECELERSSRNETLAGIAPE